MAAKKDPVPPQGLAGKVGLAEAIQALRKELAEAIIQAPGTGVRFGLGTIVLTVEAAVTTSLGGHAGIKWWLVEAGAESSREAVTTQTLQLTLNPQLVRKNPDTNELEVTDVLVTDTDEPTQPANSERFYTPPSEAE